LVRRPLIGPLYQPRTIDGNGALGGFRSGRRNGSTGRKPVPVPPLCPLQIPQDVICGRTRAAAVGIQQLTLRAMAWSISHILNEDCLLTYRFVSLSLLSLCLSFVCSASQLTIVDLNTWH
jgi:hypothetical protein